MLFIESRIFTRILHDYLSDDDYRELQAYLAENPGTGDGAGRGSSITGRLRTARFIF